ncbi:MAG: hypothetical protein CM15mP83_7400 [Flavobacteriaceae bacterium]|nr:MAG: hypothetical protein CM15mP83_7400 [Flavobacteriaceae bacterium]
MNPISHSSHSITLLHQSLLEVKDLLPSKIVFSAVKGIVPESKDVWVSIFIQFLVCLQIKLG